MRSRDSRCGQHECSKLNASPQCSRHSAGSIHSTHCVRKGHPQVAECSPGRVPGNMWILNGRNHDQGAIRSWSAQLAVDGRSSGKDRVAVNLTRPASTPVFFSAVNMLSSALTAALAQPAQAPRGWHSRAARPVGLTPLVLRVEWRKVVSSLRPHSSS